MWNLEFLQNQLFFRGYALEQTALDFFLSCLRKEIHMHADFTARAEWVRAGREGGTFS